MKQICRQKPRQFLCLFKCSWNQRVHCSARFRDLFSCKLLLGGRTCVCLSTSDIQHPRGRYSACDVAWKVDTPKQVRRRGFTALLQDIVLVQKPATGETMTRHHLLTCNFSFGTAFRFFNCMRRRPQRTLFPRLSFRLSIRGTSVLKSVHPIRWLQN